MSILGSSFCSATGCEEAQADRVSIGGDPDRRMGAHRAQ
jgi:hypothetical protein